MIVKVTMDNVDEVLPLIKEYQAFYGVKNIDEQKNKIFFSQFAQSSDKGMLHMYKLDDTCIGFTTLYRTFSSTRAEEVAVLNDLYIKKEYRAKGYGKALIENAFNIAKEEGFSRVQWLTAKDNETAQKLYKSLGATQSSWYFYAKDL